MEAPTDSPDNLIAALHQISWVIDRCNRPQPSRYESGLYGLLNMFLVNFFSAQRYFLVKPQSTLRPAVSLDDDDNGDVADEANTSLDSAGRDVQGRGQGREPDTLIPDWVVAKATRHQNADVPILIVEVKRDDMRVRKAREQLSGYMSVFRGEPYFRQLKGLLVKNTVVEFFEVNHLEPVVRSVSEPDETITSQVTLEFLTSIARSHWEMPVGADL